MAKSTSKNNTGAAPAKSGKTETIKSLAWLVEATFRGFVGWLLLTNFHNYVVVVAAVYALVTAGIIVVSHFVKAHKG